MCAHRCNHRLVAIAAITVALSACQKVPMLPGLTTHQIEIQQGNVVTQEMIDKLKPGMSRQQVRFVMGTPPIVDPFHKDRWDYVYYLNRAGKLIEHRRLVLLFDGDVLKRVEGDVVGSGGTGAAKPGTGATVKPREPTADVGGTGTVKPEASGTATTEKPREPAAEEGAARMVKPETGAGTTAQPRETTTAEGQAQPQADKQVTP